MCCFDSHKPFSPLAKSSYDLRVGVVFGVGFDFNLTLFNKINMNIPLHHRGVFGQVSIEIQVGGDCVQVVSPCAARSMATRTD